MLMVFPAAGASSAQPVPPIVIEGESLLSTAEASEGSFGPQEMSGFGAGWGGHAQLFWAAPRPGAQLRLRPELPAPGFYEVTVFLTVAPDFGILEISLGPVAASFDGYADHVDLRLLALGALDLAAGGQQLTLKVTGKGAGSTGHYVGMDRIEFHRVQRAAAPSSPASLAPWTTQDVIDSRIDVAAQYALMRMLAGDPQERIVGSNILSAVKEGALGGVYQEDQQVPALRAQASGYGWWQILPKPAAGHSIDGVCMTDPASKPPVLVMRKKAESNPIVYDLALQGAWYACGLPPAPVRPYTKTLPNKQPAAKSTRCPTPTDGTQLMVSTGDGVAGVKVSVQAPGAAYSASAITDGTGLAYFTLPGAGQYLVISGGLPGATSPQVARSKTVEALAQCFNYTDFDLGKSPPVNPCSTPEIKEANAQCNTAYTDVLVGACGARVGPGGMIQGTELEGQCAAQALKHYNACMDVVMEALKSCKDKLP